MAYQIKNLSGFPLDIATTTGPAILPAYGTIKAELGAYDAEAMRFSPYVEMTEAGGLPDHDGDDKKGSSVPTDDRDIDDLRAQYEELFGEAPDRRWGDKRLQAEIDKKLAE